MTTQERLEKFMGCVAGIHTPDDAQRMFDNFKQLEDFSSLAGLVHASKSEDRPLSVV